MNARGEKAGGYRKFFQVNVLFLGGDLLNCERKRMNPSFLFSFFKNTDDFFWRG